MEHGVQKVFNYYQYTLAIYKSKVVGEFSEEAAAIPQGWIQYLNVVIPTTYFYLYSLLTNLVKVNTYRLNRSPDPREAGSISSVMNMTGPLL